MREALINPEFGKLATRFFELTNEQDAGGAALCVYRNGKPVIDLWAGEARPSVPWNSESKTLIFSSTKGLLSILAHRAIAAGLLDINERVATYWPEFGCNGKEEITVAMVMRHRAGLSAPRADLTFQDILDLEPVLSAFARQAPIWEPDTGFGYHPLSFGHLLGKILSSATGLPIGELLQREISRPLAVDAWIGIPDEVESSMTLLITDDGPLAATPVEYSNEYWLERGMTFGKAMTTGVASDFEGFNDPRLFKAELSGAAGISDARSIAKIYSATVTDTDGVRLLADETILAALNHRNPGDNVWHEPQPHPIHSLGFIAPNAQHSPILSETTFGHDGLGGQQGFGDIEYRIGFGYVTNWIPLFADGMERHRELTRVLKECLDAS